MKDYFVSLNQKPVLSTEVLARYSDGTTETININWNSYDETQLKSEQIFKVTGKLEGTEVPVVVDVHVIGNVVAMENVSTFLYKGSELNLPNTVKGYLADGTQSEDFKVNWNLANVDLSKENTTVSVPGTVELLGKTYNVTASARIVPALSAARNLAINNSSQNSDIPTLSQSPTTTSDNLNSIINNVTNNGSSVNERWTNWNERSLTAANGEPKGAYVQLNWRNKYNIDRLDLWLFTDNSASRIPKKVEISYKNENGDYVVVPHTNTTEVSYSAGETTYFLNKVINTDSIRIYMQQPEVGKCIGLTEVKVYEYVPKEVAKATNTLNEIKINGTALVNFDPSIREYSVNLDKLPNSVEAVGKDNAAVTVLPINNKKSLIFVRAEDGTRNTYTVNYLVPLVNIASNKSNENSDVPKLSQSPITITDNLNSINNGVINDGTNLRERWTNWNERALAGSDGQPKGAYVQFDWTNKHDIESIELWLFTDNPTSRLPKKVEISYKNVNGEYVVVPYISTTAVSYTAGPTKYTLNQVVNTDSMRIYMQQLELGKCIGLTEVKIYE